MPIHALTNTSDRIRNQIITPVKITNIDTGKIVETFGLWDTGAQSCVIRHDLASYINLVPRGLKTIRGVQSQENRDYYYANLKLNNEQISLDIEMTDVDPFTSDKRIGMLIGMDVITKGDFSISNFNGHTVMTFRKPSQGTIDYCAENALYNKYQKIHIEWLKNGNTMCPCHSGKKWDQCHGKIFED